MQSPEQVAERVLSAVHDLYDGLSAELADAPEEVLWDARTCLHRLTKDIPGASLSERDVARQAGAAAPLSPPEKWLGWTASAMAVALLQARRMP